MQQQLALDWQSDPIRGTRTVRLLATISGTVPPDATRTPLQLALVLDRSGSMCGEKLDAAQQAALGLVRRLHPDDLVGVVAFDHEVTTVAPLGRGTEHDALTEAVRALFARGNTNLAGGWLRGEALLHPVAGEGARARLLLLTDGQANEGITNPAQLRALAETARRRGITTSTIGFGADYDEDLLRHMADAGGGNAWYIERPDQAVQVFGEELAGLQALVAQDVRVTLRLSAAGRALEFLQDWPSTPAPDGVVLDLGDLYAREPKRVLARWIMDTDVTGPDAVLGTIECSAAVVTATGIERRVISTPITASFDEQTRVEPVIAREVLAQEAATARREAVERGDRGDAVGAAYQLKAAAAMYAALPDDEEAARQQRDLERLAKQYEYGTASAADRKYLKQRAYNQRRGKYNYDKTLERDDPST
jgi:Ca-activated chloride channel homolog